MKVLVTGARGFVATYLIPLLQQNGCSVTGVDLAPRGPQDAFDYRMADLTNRAEVFQLMDDICPDALIHLAAVSSVGQSWKIPGTCFTVNTGIFVNLLESVRESGAHTRILAIGSSEAYGEQPESLPYKETVPCRPSNPYAVARVAQETLARFYIDAYDLDIVQTRSFNHIGRGQKSVFVIPSFINQIKRLNGKGVIETGNVEVVRDFLDVRDVCTAYWSLLQRGEAGSAYNVCGGVGYSLREVIRRIAAILNKTVEIQVDPTRLRRRESLQIVGDNGRMKREIGWSPKYSLDETLNWMTKEDDQ